MARSQLVELGRAIVLAHPLDSAPGGFTVVRTGEALDHLDQISTLNVGTNSSGLRGSIAHIAIWNRLLSSAEIASMWTAGQIELRSTPMYHSYV
jgi:hypothetical protein